MIRIAVVLLAVLGLAACEQREGSRGPYVGGSGGVNVLR
jgi:hypothetical protein